MIDLQKRLRTRNEELPGGDMNINGGEIQKNGVDLVSVGYKD